MISLISDGTLYLRHKLTNVVIELEVGLGLFPYRLDQVENYEGRVSVYGEKNRIVFASSKSEIVSVLDVDNWIIQEHNVSLGIIHLSSLNGKIVVFTEDGVVKIGSNVHAQGISHT